ncbi:DUF1553 domain-containing protein [Phragmitibacter flavus]|uniref:DUF1553 domain-containing protein n=1 Tax=Phragmitibacter flavus TaxID=2576071 RepID=A0A5R8KHX4_9BACT|nr:DUF1549 and DUF1553 domain-containing protein [Phragmitibacter flavus]TLD71882.1 DUF1553 domain-containing protein [Phragmitibacter flavus]
MSACRLLFLGLCSLTAVLANERDVESAREFWSYRKPVEGELPVTVREGWARRELDFFVLSKLEAEGLEPSADAELVTLLRRVYFDLVGFLPSPNEVEVFVKLASVDVDLALAKTVNGLLASPRFGERWGRHWLDVARFAESNGREANLTFPHAWRYRDYVIDAVNADVPFDRFITEQVAGDLLPAKDAQERARLLVATGFLAMGAKGLGEFDKKLFAADLADEQLDAVSRSVMASSVACARCHDHFTEPFSMEDYYALAGIFKSTKTYFGNWVDSENNNDGDVLRLPEVKGQLIPNRSMTLKRKAELEASLVALDLGEKEDNEFMAKAKAEGRDLSADYTRLLQRGIGRYWQRGQIGGELRTVDEKGRALPLAMGVMDGEVIDSPMYERGEIGQPGSVVKRRFPKVFEVDGVEAPGSGSSGRLELARWLTSREHPLTARVMVNRVWRHLFGAGLVRTVDSFGFDGELPSHPELLDHLAVKFMERGWSVKAMVREMVLSRTYRQASDYREEGFEKDPDNRFLWRMSKRRLDAEVIRDSMLVVSGLMDFSRRPGSLVAEIPGQAASLIGFNEKIPKDLDGSRRRSVYLPVLRDLLPEAMEHFDVANPSLVTGDRSVTNGPLQALYLMNGTFVQEQAEGLAQRVMEAGVEGDDARVNKPFEICYNRDATSEELEMAREFFARTRSEMAVSEADAMKLFCQALLASGEFRNAD